MKKSSRLIRGVGVGVAAVLALNALFFYTPGSSVKASGTTQSELTTNPDNSLKLASVSTAKIYEAEDADLIGGATKNNNHTGYSGTGFVDNLYNQGTGVSFAATAGSSGDYTLDIRYSYGANDADTASLELFVNGQSQGVIKMADLGSWDKWWDETVNVQLNQGSNTIELERTSNCDTGAVNLDYITLKPSTWKTPGKVNSVERDGNTFTFDCDNAAAQIKVCGDDIVKVWVEPTKIFARKYDSFSVVKEDFNPSAVSLVNDADDYQIQTGDLTVVINKSSFGLTYKDAAGNILTQSAGSNAFAWDSNNQLKVNNQISQDETFWGTGEKTESVAKNGTNMTMWSTDYLNGWQDAFTAKQGEGRWYLSDPHVVSSKGYSIFFDNTSRTQFDFGKTDPGDYSFGTYNPMPGGELCYYFIGSGKASAQDKVKALTTSFTDLVGKSFFAPEWAYGNMQSHYGYHQSDVLDVASEYRSDNIPLDAMMADIEYYYNQCSPTQVNTANFPDLKSMVSTLHSEGVKFGLIDDPNISAATTSTTDYTDGVNGNYFVKGQDGKTSTVIWPWGSANGVAASGASGLLDFFNPQAASWWRGLHSSLISDGLDMFWLDMNEPARYRPDWTFYNTSGKGYGTLAELHNAYALADDQAMYELMSQNNQRSFLLTRSGFTGTQRYASPWTGDISATWTDMANQIRLGTGLSLSGFNYWGFDIGGFQEPSDYNNYSDQFKRWIEFSTFIPVHRFHYAGTTSREPWNFGAESVAQKYITLRYQLNPYFYSLTGDSVVGTGLEGTAGTGTGIPLFRPLMMEYADDTNTYNLDGEFMSGPSLLVAPVVEDASTKNVYLPKGLWYDYNDGSTVTTALNGGAWLNNYAAPVDTLPVFVKAGAIIPMMQPVQSLNNSSITKLTLDVYPLQSGSSRFVQYEDDGTTDNYKNGDYATTAYTSDVSAAGGTTTINVGIGARTGKYAASVPSRSGVLQLHLSAFDYNNVSVPGYTQVNSQDALVAGTYYVDNSAKVCYVAYTDDGSAKSIQVQASTYAYNEVTGTYVKNANFDSSTDLPNGSNPDGWYEEHPDGQVASCGIDSNDSVSGNKCYFYNGDTAFKQGVYQNVTGLPAGKYKVTAQVKVSNETPSVCQMQLNGTNIDITGMGSYETVSGEVTVGTDGVLKIGFYVDGPQNTSVQIDNVQLFQWSSVSS